MKVIRYFTFLILCVTFISCKEKDLPDETFIDFAKKVEQQMVYGNATSAINAFDYDEIEKRITEGMNLSEKEKKQAAAFIRNLENPINLIVEKVKNGADFRFIKFYRKDNEPHIVFRIYYNGEVSMEDWTLGVKDGQVRIFDAFLIVSGIYWSDDYRQQLDHHLQIYTDEVINISKLISVNHLISEGEYEQADSMLYWLMPQMQDNMYARTMELRFASLTAEYAEVQALAEQFDKSFPQAKRTSTYYLMQSTIQQGIVDEAIQHILTLINSLGDDPIYYLYQAWVFQSSNSPKYALESLDSAILYIPNNIDFHLYKMDIYYDNYDYENCVNLLYHLDSLISQDEGDVPFFSESYPKLKEYKPFTEWINNRRQLTINN